MGEHDTTDIEAVRVKNGVIVVNGEEIPIDSFEMKLDMDDMTKPVEMELPTATCADCGRTEPLYRSTIVTGTSGSGVYCSTCR